MWFCASFCFCLVFPLSLLSLISSLSPSLSLLSHLSICLSVYLSQSLSSSSLSPLSLCLSFVGALMKSYVLDFLQNCLGGTSKNTSPISLFWLLQIGIHSCLPLPPTPTFFFFSRKTTIYSANHCLSFCWLEGERMRWAGWECGEGDGEIMTDLMIINIFCLWIVKVSSKSPSQAQVKLLVCGFKSSATWHAGAGLEGVILYMWNSVVLFYYYYWVNHAYLKRKLYVNPLSRWINVFVLSYLAHNLNYQKAYVLIIKGFGVPQPLIFISLSNFSYLCLMFVPIF